MIGFLAFVLFILFIYGWCCHTRRHQAVPIGLREMPVESGYPIVGAFFRINRPHSFHVGKLGKKHGPLFAIRIGMRDIVVLNNYDTIKKALKDNGKIFSGRFTVQLKKHSAPQSGIIFHDGESWAKQRSFIVNVFRDFGLGHSKSMEIVENECIHLIENLTKMDGINMNLFNFIFYHVANTICKFIMNKRFTRESEELKVVEQIMRETAKSKNIIKVLGLMFPFFDSLPLYSKFVTMFSTTTHLYQRIFALIQLEIDEHLKRLNFHSEGQDLMDRFLIKQHKMKEKYEIVESFTDWQLVMISYEMFSAGSETTTTSLEWSCMFMSRFPEVQQKVYLEINDKIGTDRMVKMSDKTCLNYTQAVLDEIMRMSSVIPFSIPHRTIEDSSLDGIFIPKDSIIYPNIIACHYDPDIWESPMEFKPERFLTMDPEGQLKYTPRKELIPFGIGNRQCIGESLARIEYFIYFTNIIQKFQIASKDPLNDKLYEKTLRGIDSLIRPCYVKDFVFRSRA